MRSNFQVWIKPFLRYGFILSIFCFLLYNTNFRELEASFDWRLVAAVLGMQIPTTLGTATYAIRFAVLARVPPVPFWGTLEAVILSGIFNLFAPANLGDAIKVVYLKNRFGVSASCILSTMVLELLLDTILFGVIGFALFLRAFLPSSPYFEFLPIMAGVAFILLRPLAKLVVDRIGPHERPTKAFFRTISQHILNVLRVNIMFRACLLTFLTSFWFYLGVFIFFRVQPFGQLSWQEALVVFVAMVFARAVPGLPAGIGVTQAAVVLVLQPMGYGFNQALVVAIVIHFGGLLNSAITGSILLLASPGILQLLNNDVTTVPAAQRWGRVKQIARSKLRWAWASAGRSATIGRDLEAPYTATAGDSKGDGVRLRAKDIRAERKRRSVRRVSTAKYR
jgi:glycosyltransferase 2 family protein